MREEYFINNRGYWTEQKRQIGDAILHDMDADDIVYIDDVLGYVVEKMRKKQILEAHGYKKWQGKDGKWYTHIPDDTKKEGRKLIKRLSEQKLDEAIIEAYELAQKETQAQTLEQIIQNGFDT